MARGGKREGAGRPPGPVLPPVADKSAAGRILEALNAPEPKEGEKSPQDTKEIERWRLLADAKDLRLRFDVLKYLYDKRDGKAVQPVDFGDKPLGVKIITGAELPPA